jgi:hypothetical protein
MGTSQENPPSRNTPHQVPLRGAACSGDSPPVCRSNRFLGARAATCSPRCIFRPQHIACKILSPTHCHRLQCFSWREGWLSLDLSPLLITANSAPAKFPDDARRARNNERECPHIPLSQQRATPSCRHLSLDEASRHIETDHRVSGRIVPRAPGSAVRVECRSRKNVAGTLCAQPRRFA